MASSGPPRVKNKAPAPIQITAEQILRESYSRQEPPIAPPKQKIADLEELHEYQGRKRKYYEDQLRGNRLKMGEWMNYAAWELQQNEFARARSVFERALDADGACVPLWLRYIESEIKTRNINHARNLFDRAVTVLPRVDNLWFKYVYMEETLGNIAGTRQVFERWMAWEPAEAAWFAYIKFETRYQEYARVRAIYERFTVVHPEPKYWIRWARFEEEFGSSDNVREVFSMAIDALGDEFMEEKLFIAYARYETKMREYERARVIYKYALDRMPRSKSATLYSQYTAFEKQFGEKEGIEDVVLSKRRVRYEETVTVQPKNYDAWFDYVRLEESAGDVERVRDVYERAIAQLPPSQEKRHWRRFIYLWLEYALWEELETKDFERARAIWKACLGLIPHKKFTFAKVWLGYSHFEVRRLNLTAARKNLGMALGMCPKDKLFKGYIELELLLREFDRVRTLYEKFLEHDASSCYAWIKYSELERMLGDMDRARAIYEIAVEQEVLDMPELLWKSWIDMEVEEEEWERARGLYERLLSRTGHVKVWISFAEFEVSVPGEGQEGQEEEDEDEEVQRPATEEAKENARAVFKRALEHLRQRDLKEDRVILLEAWKSFESAHGTEQSLKDVEAKMPKIIKKRRAVGDGSFEEYFDYLFPDEEERKGNMFGLLARAQKWKEEMARKAAEKEKEQPEA
ncbi:pre-mRNA-splicing factor Clf1 [Saitoella complicata NRRL Y-17804]|uniref:Suppressor of forked domain-containing protein n=1 Tax=Saitoella complicata (strain BCRC 22490 / CBS 7301 / JCM 7358 / NBRC 10748 / NRRL Y-17804) TaxID=698492 RepID=A0A0E9NGI1_SAICN|nr:pre-mRNA-splicing factor Clf1 [Saitoella complicata NRRL Y-17804]ODQ53055.1 pre-mRNA-splicing factor Clf1 [Saitoella complicata NRRL Y-17804]GAO48982.1 hypothetical protein G7K_3143-t1 [Saitoella complicata NRRL Y-17804]